MPQPVDPDKCRSCDEPREIFDLVTGQCIGVIIIDEDGLCEDCADKKEMGRIRTEDDRAHGELNDPDCEECARSYGPHYQGACGH